MRAMILGGLVAAAWVATMVAGPAAAQEAATGDTEASGPAGEVAIELNKLEDRDNACRAYFVLENQSDIAFTELRLDLYIFDADGEIFRRLLLDPGEMEPGKTRVMLFDATEITCGGIGRFLLDGVLSCADTDGSREDCDDLLALSSRLDTPFED